MLLVGVIAFAVLTPIALNFFQERFAVEEQSEGPDERTVFNNVTAMMLAEESPSPRE